MMDRINKLCRYLSPCRTFADIGCDHGYCTLYMLKNNLCEKAIVSDVSEKCLQKAETLLKKYVSSGKCIPVCCYGLEKIEKTTDLILIAGMGGEEIISILKSAYIPQNFVLQPMRNVRGVREYLLEQDAEITCDDVFESGGKYYFVISGKRQGNKSTYTPARLEFGYGDISGALGGYLREELLKKQSYLKRNLSAETRAVITESIKFIEEFMNGEIS